MDPAVQNLNLLGIFNLEVECLNCWCKLVNQESSSRAAVFLDVPFDTRSDFLFNEVGGKCWITKTSGILAIHPTTDMEVSM